MNTKSCKGIPHLTVPLTALLGVLVLISVIVAILIRIERDRFQKKIERRDAIHAETLRNQKGLPATVENLQEGVVYFISARLTNLPEDETNYFVVLHKVKVVNIDDYRHSREERFFRLPFPLEPHKYFQFFRSASGKIARAEEYPPPTPPKLELRYK